jgi:hypothetical protein
MMVMNREFIGDIITSSTAGAFSANTFYVNPGNANTFPWLSNVALQFESYTCHGLLFEYRTMSSDSLNSTNTALG